MEIKSNLEDKFKDYHFRKLNETGSYFDFVTILSHNEFVIFHKKYIKSSQFNNSNIIDEFVQSLDESVRYNWVIVEVFEIDF
jgi:hypothetical protein